MRAILNSGNNNILFIGLALSAGLSLASSLGLVCITYLKVMTASSSVINFGIRLDLI